jgi:hypothetical protein
MVGPVLYRPSLSVVSATLVAPDPKSTARRHMWSVAALEQ